ncbi:major facilitator superfamily domain-containing protein 4A isoform X2 [Opisthocomus hoazin]|uniref:major facilitator superfamily domain-containing protein 4A isoform X2 n=1 Tax=Opisthocomus hoazin TaxID=30419 RepID=UPI003F5345D3
MWWDERVSARFRRNLQPTLTYWSVFFSFGLCIAFLGPTLLDLRCQTQSSLSQITWVFFSQQFCLLLGSCLGGVFKRTLAQSLFALFASSLAISLVFAIIPLCHNVVVLAVVMAVAGLAMGCIDTISNMQLVKIYQKDSAIFLQALHFFVGFGALLSPLIADPFLSDTNCILSNSTANASSNLPHIRKSLVPHHPGNLSHYDLPMKGMVVTRVSYAFWIMALINLPVPIAVFLLLYKERMVPCFNSSSRPLLPADELAMETRPAEKDEGSAAAQRPRAAGGRVLGLRLQLRGGRTSLCRTQSGRVPAQPLLGIHHAGQAHLHPCVPPNEAGNYGLHQRGWNPDNLPPAPDFLLQRCLLVCGDSVAGAVSQQHLPQHARLHRGHPAVQRLCHNRVGDWSWGWGDGPAATGGIDYT